MKFSKYLEQLPKGGKTALAKQLKIDPSYLSRLASGDRSITPSRAMDIERATAGAVTRKDLFPKDWFDHWPELAVQKGNDAQKAA